MSCYSYLNERTLRSGLDRVTLESERSMVGLYSDGRFVM